MIEVLVAIVVFSFGMLGLASLQAAAFKSHRSAWTRESVASLAEDLAERMYSNPLGARSGAYQSGPHRPSSACGLTLSPPERAACDLHTVQAFARLSLPGGQVSVAREGDEALRITVMWFDKDQEKAQTSCKSGATEALPKNCCPSAMPPGMRCFNSNFYF